MLAKLYILIEYTSNELKAFPMSGLIVHEWLEPRGGAERVVDCMVAAYPDADLCALWNDAPERFP